VPAGTDAAEVGRADLGGPVWGPIEFSFDGPRRYRIGRAASFATSCPSPTAVRVVAVCEDQRKLAMRVKIMLAVIKLRSGKTCPQWDEKSDQCVLKIAGAIGRQIARDLDRLEREKARGDKAAKMP
jgi:hypothetical protein